MVRKLRVEHPRAIYRVMNRGDRREAIFHEGDWGHISIFDYAEKPLPLF